MVPAQYTASLSSAADAAISSVLSHGVPGQISPPSSEVGFVAAVVLGGVWELAQAWKPLLAPLNLSVNISGVFCHQSPKATFLDAQGMSASCELADLLVVVEDYTGVSPYRRWATLIQAKMANAAGGQSLSKSGDLRQLHLMSNWPQFTLPYPYWPGPRDFSTCTQPGSLSNCGRYGLITGQPNPTWHQHIPAAVMSGGGVSLGAFLAGMVETGQTRFGREATGVVDDWSRTIEELMCHTYAQVFNYRRGFSGSKPRGRTAVALVNSDLPGIYFCPPFFATSYLSFDGPPDRSAEGTDLREEPLGMSLLRIAIQ